MIRVDPKSTIHEGHGFSKVLERRSNIIPDKAEVSTTLRAQSNQVMAG